MQPESVAALTPAQLQIILLRTADTGQTIQLTPQEAEAFRAERLRQKEAWIEEHLANVRSPDGHRPIDRPHQGLAMLAHVVDRLPTFSEHLAQSTTDCHEATANRRAQAELRHALHDILKQFEESLAKTLQPVNRIRSQAPAHFSDGP